MTNSSNSGKIEITGAFKSLDNVLVALNILSAVIMSLGTESPLSGVILALMSIPMLLKPASLLPVLFVSSWSVSIKVIFVSAFYFYMLLFVLSLVLNWKQWRFYTKDIKSSCAICLFALWVIITGITSVSGNPYSAIKLSIAIFFIAGLSQICLSGMSICNRSILYMAILFSVMFLVRSIFFPIEFFPEESRIVEYTIVPGLGVNCIGQAIVILFIYCFCHYLSEKNIWGLSFAALYFLVLFFLGSRTSLYSSLILAIFFFLIQWKTTARNKIILASFILVTASVIFSFGNQFENFQRLSVSTFADDKGSGRFTNWALYLYDIILQYPLFGIGTGIDNFGELGYSSDSDNLYMDLLCQTGIPGLILFFICFILILRKVTVAPKGWKDRGLVITLVLSFLVIGIGESVYESPLTWFIFGYAALSANNLNLYASIKRQKSYE